MPPDTPAEPMQPLHESALALHEMFLAWMAAGFTEDQALTLVAKLMAEGHAATDD